jgi:Holliday junction DNA helicase RuvB
MMATMDAPEPSEPTFDLAAEIVMQDLPAGGLRVVAPGEAEEDRDDRSLRPSRLGEFVGQATVKDALDVAIRAASERAEPLDHTLFYGPPGLGKTTLARIIAAEMGVSLRTTSGPALARPGDLAAILNSLGEHDVHFIDEVHRLPRGVEEVLYPAMEDFALDIMMGKGPSARPFRLSLRPFTLVAATTRYALLSSPLRDRFGLVHRLDFYASDELTGLVERNASKLEVPITGDGAETLARRSRGTPRIANRLLRRVRDYAQVRAAGVIDNEVAGEALAQLQIDELGLDERDRELLRAIIERFGGGPVGLDTLAASIAEETDTVMDVYEPFLLQLGFLERTPRGRTATAAACEHLGLEPGARGSQGSLFS